MDSDAAGMSSLLIQAAHSAAQADGLVPPPASVAEIKAAIARGPVASAVGSGGGGGGGAVDGGKKKGPALRRGKWTPEEEAYASRLIHEFKSGLLPLTDGTTLRTFLSKLLNCDPMRISKKFVGSNCIGKQVFRRRNADINRLTAEQIQQSRAELSELERRFLERVAQTNRVKSSGVGGTTSACPANSTTTAPATMTSNGMVLPSTTGSSSAVGSTGMNGMHHSKGGDENGGSGGAEMNTSGAANNHNNNSSISPPSPPWLAPPLGYKPGNGAAFAAANLANSRAAAAGRALLGGVAGLMSPPASTNSLSEAYERSKQQVSAAAAAAELPWRDSAGLLGAMAEMQKQASQHNLINALSGSQNNFFQSNNNSGFSSQAALSQLQQNASAARLADLASSNSLNSLMLKTGISREQLAQLAGGGRGGIQDSSCGLSSSSLSNMVQRQNSFDALMSLNFQSLQSIDNLANLMQTGNMSQVPETGLKNADFGLSNMINRQSLGGGGGFGGGGGGGGGGGVASAPSSEDLNAAARRLASVGRMESLLKSLSSGNVRGSAAAAAAGDQGFSSSNANLSNLLQTIQGAASNHNFSAASLLGAVGGGNNSGGGGGGGPSQSAVSLADLFRQDSSTGLSALRMQDGLNNRNSSVDDFLSLMAAGDIPHQDPSLLNVPLMQQQQAGNQDAAVRLLAQSQILQQAAANRSFGNLAAMAAGQSPSSMSSHQLGGLFAAHQQQQQQQEQQQQQQQHQQLQQHLQQQQQSQKRKLDELGELFASQGGNPNKR